jgi:tetratricopeptide (TPR) repeat protein
VGGWLQDGWFVHRADRLAEEIIQGARQIAHALHHRVAYSGTLAFECAVGERAQFFGESAHHHVVDASKPDEAPFVNGGHGGVVAFAPWRKPFMAGRYGMTFAAKFIEQGKYAEAVDEATRAFERDQDDPAPLVERATAYAWLEQYSAAVNDFEAALALDETAGVLEIDVVDDAYFSALLGAAKIEARTSLETAFVMLARYRRVLPGGRHLADAELWPARLQSASGAT